MISLVVCLALLQDSSVYVDSATGLRFTEKSGALSRGEIDDYAKKGSPHLGVSIQYYLQDEEERMVMSLNVYIYDLGEKHIPDGVESEFVKKHFEQVKGDVTGMKGPKGWQSVKHIADGRAKLGMHRGAPVALKSEFETTIEGGRTLGSLIYLRGYKNRFVKIRVTYQKEAKKVCEEEYERLLADIGRQIKMPSESEKTEK